MQTGIDLTAPLRRIGPSPRLPRVDAGALRHVRIVKLSSLGDVVCALPFATALADALPHVRLSWAVERRFAPIVALHRGIDDVIDVPAPSLAFWLDRGERRRVARRLRRDPVDLVVDLQGLAKSTWVARASRPRAAIGIEGQREASFCFTAAVPPDPRPSILHQYRAPLRFLGIAEGRLDAGIAPSPAGVAKARALLPEAAPRVAIHATASRSWKSPSVAFWIRLGRRLAERGPVVLLGAEAEAPRSREIARALGAAAVDLTGATDLDGLAGVLDRVEAVVGGDSGILHLAAALGTPTVGLFGPTSPERFGGWEGPASAIRGRAGCGIACPRWCARRRCLESIDVGDVLRALAQRAPLPP